jgi:hypothetical protein
MTEVTADLSEPGGRPGSDTIKYPRVDTQWQGWAR